MRRLLAGVVTMAVLLLASPARADEIPDVPIKRFHCADIVYGDGFNSGTTVGFYLQVREPTCRFVTYTLYVLDESGDATPIASQSLSGDGSSLHRFFSVEHADDDPSVCVYATTSVGRHVLDRALNEGCVPLVVGSGPPQLEFY